MYSCTCLLLLSKNNYTRRNSKFDKLTHSCFSDFSVNWNVCTVWCTLVFATRFSQRIVVLTGERICPTVSHYLTSCNTLSTQSWSSFHNETSADAAVDRRTIALTLASEISLHTVCNKRYESAACLSNVLKFCIGIKNHFYWCFKKKGLIALWQNFLIRRLVKAIIRSDNQWLKSTDDSGKDLFIIKPTRCTNFPNLLRRGTLHVSGSSCAHHQEFIHCIFGTGVCHTEPPATE